MFRGLLLCFVCIGILGSSWCYDDFDEIPECEGKAPDDIYFDLSRMGLTTIQRPIATSSTIKCLNVENNNIQTIAADAFDGLPELFYLNLARNPIVEIDVTSIPKLKTLIMDATNTDWVQKYLYKNLSWSLPELEKLSFRNNGNCRYNNHEKGLFRVPKITHLFLSGSTYPILNFISRLSESNNLTDLHMDFCDLTNLHQLWARNLQYLSLERNQITSLSQTPRYDYEPQLVLPRGMHNLEFLSLANNQISSIDRDAFGDLINLRVLNLASNSITELTTNPLSYLVNLKNLTLDHNGLSNVPEICALQELQFLLLNNNRITSIDQTSFCNLPNLSLIEMSGNGLTSIANETFGHLPALVALDLSGNKLVSLPENWFFPRNSVIELYLADNDFGSIKNMSLGQLKGLETLSIENNPLKTVSRSSLKHLPEDTDIQVCQSGRYRYY